MERPEPPEMTTQEKIDLLYEVGCIGVRNFLIKLGHDLTDPDVIPIRIRDGEA